MNYEIEYKWKNGKGWLYWVGIKNLPKARKHIELLRRVHKDRKFRIVKVTRKVVKG